MEMEMVDLAMTKETEMADLAVREGDREGVDHLEYARRKHRWCGIVPEVMQLCEYGFCKGNLTVLRR
jgi:hypothetical protein